MTSPHLYASKKNAQRAAMVYFGRLRSLLTTWNAVVWPWVKRMLELKARTALTSGGLEPVIDSGGGGHSVFVKAFITALAENGGVIEGQRLFNLIKRPVLLIAIQTPQYSDIRLAGHEGGDFIFVKRRR